jgi:hypothetical protein
MQSLTRMAAAIVAMSAAACTSPETSTSDACTRQCLIDLAEDYLAALAAHDPGRAPLADDFVAVENIEAIRPGEGLWSAAAGRATGFRIYVPDPVEGTIGLFVVIDRESGDRVVPALFAARLRVEDGRITEAEQLVADVPEEADLARLESPRPGIVAIVPEGERMSRDELASIAASYYDALDLSDGRLAPFADDCEREENGLITAGPDLGPAPFDSVDVDGRSPPAVARDCIGQMSSRRFAYIDSIDNRRIFAVDPVQGLAMGLSHFRQSMAQGPHLMIAADGSELMWEEKRDPYDLPAAHIFKITDGKIHEVEALGIFVPYGSPTAWD